ncbi:MAG TPA: signal recognition particle protein [bacterium]|nr:signal recognition particle protein [bacterium]
MLESFSEKLSGVFRKLSGQGRISEKNVQDALRELRFTLLDADVNFEVVKKFIADVKQAAMGEEVLKSLTPHQQFFKIVRDNLISLLGGELAGLQTSSSKPSVYLMCGLQGSGKTTTCGKLGLTLSKKDKKVLATPLDIYRPAAIEQLKVVAGKTEMDFYFPDGDNDPVSIARKAVRRGIDGDYDILLLDSAGRLHVDQKMMDEIKAIISAVNPTEVLLVLDGMTGQDAVNIATSFDPVGVTGIILTKMDGDTRGGAALSVKQTTGKPIKLIGTGEKFDMLEPFHPDRFVSRILGMGDMMSLIERVEESVNVEEAKKLEQKLRKEQFDFEDFLAQIRQVKKMGSITNVLSMIPGLGALKKQLPDELADKQMGRVEAIVYSMTPEERRNPSIINASRKRRIAKGSGVTVQEVNHLLKQFDWMKKMIGQMQKGKFQGMNLGRFM